VDKYYFHPRLFYEHHRGGQTAPDAGDIEQIYKQIARRTDA
jgi:hypothetical protein